MATQQAVRRRGPYTVTSLGVTGLVEEVHHRTGSIRFRLRYQLAPGVTKEVVVKARTRGEAKREAERIKGEVAIGSFSAPSRLTVEGLWQEWQEQWLAQIEAGERRPRSFENVEGRMRKYILPVIGRKRISVEAALAAGGAR